jgi:hypothetical protein
MVALNDLTLNWPEAFAFVGFIWALVWLVTKL